MKRIYKVIQSLTPKPDKLAHFFFGFILMLIGSVLDIFLNTSLLAFVLPIVFGIGKEILDKEGYGEYEMLDVVFTISPCLILTL